MRSILLSCDVQVDVLTSVLKALFPDQSSAIDPVSSIADAAEDASIDDAPEDTSIADANENATPSFVADATEAATPSLVAGTPEDVLLTILHEERDKKA